MILEGKKALITGAGRGIGRQIALNMVKEGADVIVIDLFKERVDETASMARELGGKAYAGACDIGNYAETEKCLNALVEEAGGLDILVNCAGIFKEAYFVDMTPEQWNETITVDLTSAYNVTHSVIQHLIKAKGSVVNIASQDAFYGCIGYAHYGAAKAGIVGLTRTLARELGPEGVRFNVVAPGITATEMTRDRIETGRQGYLDKLPVGRIGEPDDIAYSVIFLASEKSGYITGQVIHCNGGMYLG